MKHALAAIASLRLTVVLFAMGMFIVFAGTLAQVDESIWQVLENYFRTAFAYIELRLFFPRHVEVPGGFWFPGGWLIAVALLVNLLAAHAMRFKVKARGSTLAAGIVVVLFGGVVTWWVIHAGSRADLTAQRLDSYWRILYQLVQASGAAIVLLAGCLLLFKGRAGIVLLHAGIVLLIVSELLTGSFAVESTMTLREGETSRYLDVTGEYELAMIDASPADHDAVTVVPMDWLRKWHVVTDEPAVDIEVLELWQNASPAIDTRMAPMVKPDPRVTAGVGLTHAVVPRPSGAGVEGMAIDAPAAIVRLKSKAAGDDLGTFLVSTWFDANFSHRTFDGRQTFTLDGREYELALRPRRIYLPYSVTLEKFTHEVYPGTTMPKDFASDIVLNDASGGVEDRPVRIWMNNPMRYGGRIFYQAAFIPDNSGTVLQVVKNPGWMTPYVACMIVATGMLWHFGASLLTFARKRATSLQRPPTPVGGEPQPRERLGVVVRVVAVALAGLWLVSKAWVPATAPRDYDLRAFGELPVMYEGRVQPVDTLARNALRILSGKQTYVAPDGTEQPAVRWLLEAVTGRDAELAVFRVESLDLQQALGLHPRQGYRYAPAEFSREGFTEVVHQAQHAAGLDKSQRDRFDRQVLRFVGDQWMLRDKIVQANAVPRLSKPGDVQQVIDAHEQLRAQGMPMLIPPAESAEGEWRAIATAGLQSLVSPTPDEQLASVMLVFASYAQQDRERFNAAVAQLHERLRDHPPPHYDRAKVSFEASFNHAAPFYHCAVLYVFAFVLTAIGWLWRPRALHGAAGALLLLTFVAHTLALAARIYISGRPPVTNLYSSAVFIGWAAVGGSLLLERLARTGAGLAVASIAGFATLVIAHFLAGDGDTFVVLQAVLDTNFWLATHVVCITLGYAATYLAGLLAILFILRGVFTRTLDAAAERELGRMIYGSICFALLFSFVGTVLGGLWADDSWGRFWGWDPKENGALIIVIWNALILHARWGGMIRLRGLANCAVFGNIVTAWSWFGVNQLSVGLHSYGFTDSATLWLLIFVNSQLVLIALGLMPRRFWPSYAGR